MGLKRVVYRHDERTPFWPDQHVQLSQRVLNLSLVKQFILVHLFQSHLFAFLTRQVNSRKTATIYFVTDLERRQLEYLFVNALYRTLTRNVTVNRKYFSVLIIVQFYYICRIQIIFTLQKSLNILLKMLFFWKGLFLFQIMTKIQHLIQVPNPFFTDILVNKLHIYLLILQNYPNTKVLFPFVGFYLLDLFSLHFFRWVCRLLIFIKCEWLCPQD